MQGEGEKGCKHTLRPFSFPIQVRLRAALTNPSERKTLTPKWCSEAVLEMSRRVFGEEKERERRRQEMVAS